MLTGGLTGGCSRPTTKPIDPIGTTSASAACTQLTEDDNVFAVMGFFQDNDPACYVTLHRHARHRRNHDDTAAGGSQGSLVQHDTD